MSFGRAVALLGIFVTIVQLGAFWTATEALASHGARMETMIAKMDQAEYLRLADTMLGTHRFALSPKAAPEIFRTPGYPAFVALTYLVSDHWYYAPFVGSSILLGLLAAVTALLAAELGLSRRYSLTAGLLMGISSGSFLLSITATGSDILYALFYACAALAGLRIRNNTHALLVAGAALGLATLTRPIGILASLPLILGIPFIRTTGWRIYGRMSALAFIAWLLVLAPWYIRNELAAGTPILSTVSTFNITYYNIPMHEGFRQGVSEDDTRLAILHIIGTTSPTGLRGTEYLSTMRSYNRTYLASHVSEYTTFHLYRTIPFFVASGFNVINAVLAHEAPTLRSPLFPTERDNLTHYVAAHEWGAALDAVGRYWFTTLERLSWVLAILTAFVAQLLATGHRRRALIVFAVIIVANIILVSPVTQARYRFPAEPFIWVAAVYTGATLWQKIRSRQA